MKSRIQQSLRQFIPAALVFGFLFLLLRLYELVLVANHSPVDADYISLELGSLLYDVLFGVRLISMVFASHVMFSLVSVRAAYLISCIVFILLLITTFCVNTYFSETLVPLGSDLFGYSFTDIFIAVTASAEIGWVTICALIALSLATSYFFLFTPGNFFNTLDFKGLLICTIIFFGSWFVAASPSPETFDSELHYHLAINKLQFLLIQSGTYATDHFQNETSEPFPFLHSVDYNNDLTQYFNASARKPNLVFLIVEGLGRDFTGPDALYGGFTPFLDSISAKSLYWENFLSNAGRTFGALPSILGALPYGEGGFMNYGTKMPDHQTLITLLKPLGYASNFFYGGNPNFDNQDIFLEHQGFDTMIDETKFPASFRLKKQNKEVSSWGYSDSEVFSYAEEVLQSAASPRVDVYLTLSTHEPFVVPDPSFNQLFEERLDQLKWDDLKRKTARDNKSIFSCLLYSDNAIRKLMKYYASRKDYENTIFIISGDHRLVPIPASNTIKRFHVPLIISSPLIRQPASFASLAVHSDISLSVLGILKSHGLQVPNSLSTISGPLCAEREFSSSLDLALIRNKNGISDYIEGEYFLSDDRLFKIAPDLELIPLEDEHVKNRLRQKLQKFKSNGIYACENNQLTKVRSTSGRTALSTTRREQQFIQSEDIDVLTPDEKFQRARSFAFSKNYFECRAILKILLTASPNYHDARILMARTYAWASAYDSAIFYLNQTIQRAPSYADAFTAWADVEFWRGDFETSLEVVHKGLSIDQSNADLLARKARALMVLDKEDEARVLVDRILMTDPRQELALLLRDQLNKR